MLIHMKAYGWTKKFISHVAEQGVNIRVKIQGPYADVGSPAAGYTDVAAAAAAGSGRQYQTENLDAAIIVAGGFT
jgi:hypothetical protein